jgi:DNA repair exonuclease SbcCD ATPase subunit
MKRSIAVATLTLAALTMGLAIGTRAATREDQARAAAAPQESVLPALLLEVRGLRAAMEQMASAGPRVQLALARVQLQEQRVNTMIRRLESVREAIAKAEKDASAAETSLAALEKVFKDGGAPPEGNPLTEMMGGLKKAVAAGAADAERLRSDEAALQQQITAEQARWTELNQRMEALEAALGPR